MIKFIIIGGLNYGKKKKKVHKVQMTDSTFAIGYLRCPLFLS